MTRSTLYRATVVLLLLLFSVNPDGMTVAALDEPPQAKIMDGVHLPPVVLRADRNVSTQRIPAPVRAHLLQSAPSATFTIHYIPAGQQDFFGENCLTWPTEAQTAFTYAANIWGTLIHSAVPIVIRACWTDMGASYLGYGGADDYHLNFTGAPTPNTWYPSALANALAGSDLSASRPDMHLGYNKAMADANQWYFGIDGNPPPNQYDFVSVVLHEIAHGLGFAGSMWVSGGSGSWGAGTPYPDSYDRFAEDVSGDDLINTTIYPNPSAKLATALTSNNVWFNGAYASAANGGQRVKLYAPSSWQPGSSYSHLDYATFNGTGNSLMVYALSLGASKHHPGPVSMGILRDVGWPFPTANMPPMLSGLPNQTLAPGESKNSAINLWAYASDDLDATAALTFTITNSPSLTVGVEIRNNQYIDINPTGSFTGTFPVVVEVQDTGGLTDTDCFTITFVEIANTPPVLSGLPNQTLTSGQSKNSAINLWTYAYDAQDATAALTFTITNSPPPTVGVEIRDNQYIDINPTGSFTGTFPVVVEVMDTGGLTDTGSFTIAFAEVETQYVYLPLVLKSPPCNPTIPNGNFESGPTVWSQYSGQGWPLIINSGFPGTVTPRGGSWAAWLGGDDNEVAYIQQQVTVPACAPYLSYYHWIASADECGYDFGGVLINGSVVDVYTLCGATNTGGWVKHVVNLSAYAGQTVSLQIRVETDSSGNSNLFVDDVAFQSGATMLQHIPLALDGREVRPRAVELALTRDGLETPVAVERMLGLAPSR